MANVLPAVAIVAFAVFAAGAAIGLVIAVAVAVHREDRRMSLRDKAPDRLSSGARRVNGLSVRSEAKPDDRELLLR